MDLNHKETIDTVNKVGEHLAEGQARILSKLRRRCRARTGPWSK
jgi:hypothetical protein